MPYKRNPETLARPWAIPGTPGLEHRVGGIEKQDVTGNINYEPLNHEKMVRLRAAKVEAIVPGIPDIVPAGDPDGDLLIVAWGSTYGAITAAVKASAPRASTHRPCSSAASQSAAANLGEVLDRYQQVLVPEMNMGQLLWMLAREVSGGRVGLQQDSGQPFKQAELEAEDRRNAGGGARRMGTDNTAAIIR